MNTKKIISSQLKPGMEVAENVYTYNNKMLIAKGTILTDKIITRLNFYSIAFVHIFIPDALSDAIANSESVEEKTFLQRKREEKDFITFSNDLEAAAATLRNNVKSIAADDPALDTSEMMYSIKLLLSKCRNGIQVFDLLHCVRDHDDHTYLHSINVALVCTVIGNWLQLPKNDLDVLMLCGLLHDIGKLVMPSDIINKPDNLTSDEYEVMKTHSMRGYNILRPKNIDTRIKLAAMTHHERCDGSGYPLNLHADQIDEFSKIVAIADVYDAMTSARVYRGPLCPFEVIHIFETEGLRQFESRYVLTFLEHVTQSYLGNSVRLSNGRKGSIIMMNRNSLSNPVIKCGREYIDLSREPNLYIDAII